MKKFYITTAIAYPNGKPHMGHALEIIQADALARFYRLLGKDVVFQTGTDEHGVKNWQTAKKEGKDILDFLDGNVAVFRELYDKLNISYNTFIRTSDKKVHYPGAQKLWKALEASGDLYKQKYTGLYCVGCEAFKTEKELLDGKCPNHPNREIETIEEENYFFKLSKYKTKIIELIKEDKYKVVPETRKNEILSFLENAKDVSFSRPKSSLPWGIPVPGDEEHVMYVWCDALSNYITGQGYASDEENFNNTWPADIHVIGKDILRFHAAFWPAMLISAGVELPRELFVHGFLLSGGAKMGKSLGNVVEPFEQLDKFGIDSFRYYILSSMTLDGDGDYTEELMVEKINNELAANLSNLCYRVLSFTKKNFDGEIKEFDEKDPIIKEIEPLFDIIKEKFEKRDLKSALARIMEVSSIGNRYLQEKEPWKDSSSAPETLAICINIVKNLSILVAPIMPDLSENLQKQIGLEHNELKWDDLGFDLKNHKISEPGILVKKFEGDIKKQESKPFRKVDLKVNPEVEKLGIKVASCCIKGVKIKKNQSSLKKLRKEAAKDIDYDEKILGAYEDIYRKMGLDAESTIRTLIDFTKKAGQVPNINTAVDSYNIVSAKENLSVGCHDINKLDGNPCFDFIKGDEDFTPMGGKEKWDIKKGVFSCLDDSGIICYVDLKQCDRTKVDESTENIFIYVEGNSATPMEKVESALNEICENIIKFCGGEIVR